MVFQGSCNNNINGGIKPTSINYSSIPTSTILITTVNISA